MSQDRIVLRAIDTNSGQTVSESNYDSLNSAMAIAEAENYADRRCGYSPSRVVIVISDGFEYNVTNSTYTEYRPEV